jgi:ceramide glucosyltransferase
MSVFGSALIVLILLLIVAGAVALGLSQWAAWRHFRRCAALPLPNPPPAVSILKPVEGADARTRDALASFCRVRYPGRVEVLVGTIHPGDPVVSIVGQLQREMPDRSIRLVLAPLLGMNRKTSIMETLWREASGQYLFFSDADVMASPDYLERLLPLLLVPGTGCLTCLPRGIQARRLGARLIALHYDFNYLLQWMLAQWTTGIDWAIGHTVAVPRQVLERLGGFRGFLDHLADDYEVGHRTAALGLRVVVPGYLLDCVMPHEGAWDAMRRLLRWKRTIRRARGLGFVGMGLTYPVFWALVLAALQPLAWWSWATLATVIAVRLVLAHQLQSWIRFPDWHRCWWLLPLLDVFEGLTFIGAFTGRSVVWAGRRYCLMPDGTLMAPTNLTSR